MARSSRCRCPSPSAAAILLLHITGLIDDRRALGPYSKLIIQLLAAAIVVVPFNSMRAMTFLDAHVGGPWLSIVVTILWIATITNAFNFLDNMDGLSAGVAAICATAFLITTILIGQWFVAATLACLLGATLGFLVFNFPPARIFMGDSGSLVLGFVLGVLTVRTTFLAPGQDFGAGWYALFAPLIVLALPLYDLVVVSAIRLSRGPKSVRRRQESFQPPPRRPRHEPPHRRPLPVPRDGRDERRRDHLAARDEPVRRVPDRRADGDDPRPGDAARTTPAAAGRGRMTAADEQSRGRWLGRAAFAIVVAIVLARCLMLSTLRDSDTGGPDAPFGPGASVSLTLDWLSLVPVMLLLLRRLLDDRFTLRFALVHALAVALGAWTLASTIWASDKFAALVGGTDLCAAAALF